MTELSDDKPTDDVLQKIASFFDSVIAKENFGEFVNKTDPDTLQKVLGQVLKQADDGLSVQRIPLYTIPNGTIEEFWLPLVAFNVDASSKSGYYPQNTQVAMHFREFLKRGYFVGSECVQVKFPVGDGSRDILDGTVGICDGFCKILIMVGIILITHHLELTPQELGLSEVRRRLTSFRWVRCSYTHFTNPAHHYLNALRIQFTSAEKQSPSPIDFLGTLKESVELERRVSKPGTSRALRDVLSRCVGEYNRMVTQKKHRIDTPTKNLIILLRTDDAVQLEIHHHYDLYPHTASALPTDILAADWWVPGSTTRAESSKYQGKSIFKEILCPTVETCHTWISRATKDFMRRVAPDAPTKSKKKAQLDEEGQLLLHDICLLWHWLRPKMQQMFPKNVLDQHEAMFERGSLDPDLSSVMKAAQPFEWERIPFVLEICGKSVDDFISQAQDRTRNAHTKSMAAAYNVWKELLQADQVNFESERISSEMEQSKRRSKLVAQLEDMHRKAWDLVHDYVKTNLEFFTGRSTEAESTLLPSLTAWIRDTLADIPEVRAMDDHCVVAWANMTTVGVLPAAKYDWFLTSISNLLAAYPRNGLAIVVHCNRASDPSRKAEKKEKIEKDEHDDAGAKDEDPNDDDDDDSNDDDNGDPEESDIRDMRHKLEKALASRSRNLHVKNLTWVFDKATVYGKRDACVQGLAIVHRDRLNAFRQSQGWKHAIIRDVTMLPRSAMFKPDARSSAPHLGRAFTDAQELRQVAGGTDFVRKTLGAFVPESVSTCLLADLHCYDGWVALAALEEVTEGRRVLCGNVVLDKQHEDLVLCVANKVYEDCRGGHLKVTGFPDYGPVTSAIRETQPSNEQKQYQVTLKKHDRLVVLQSLASKWMDTEFKDEVVAAIEAHNSKFNPEGEYWHEVQERNADEDDANTRPCKRIKLETSELGTEADVTNIQKPYTFAINNCAELVCGPDGLPLMLVSRSKNQFLMYRELFSFGSGDWRVGQEATELMEDSTGRWFCFRAEPTTVLILEKAKLPDHLQGLPCVESPTRLTTLLRELEDAGEVKLAITHHTISAVDKIESDKPLSFLLDPPKNPDEAEKPPKKKPRKSNPGRSLTAKNFGSVLNIAKVKKATRLVIGWRVRLDAGSGSGLKTLVPIRPVACLSGVLDLDKTVVKLF